MTAPRSDIATFLFTDIEGSTRLWEEDAARMHAALAAHDALVERCVTMHDGVIVKSTGDGVHAIFDDPLGGVQAALDLQLALLDPQATADVALRVRCGLHAGLNTRRGNDFYGAAVNRAARIMSVAHGGQVLLSAAVTELVRKRLPAHIALRELGSVRLRDLTEPEQVHQLLHAGLREHFPALRSLETTPNNLPQQLTEFIGREHEVEEVRRQLGSTRLLTIVGTGGLGKSRLALQVAADVLDEYPDGVWLVELASLSQERVALQAVASVLGVREDSGRPVQDSLLEVVRDRRLLLVLDNCEHLAQACAELARRLLQGASGVTILATSRERLAIAGERAYPLAPLATPLPSTQPDPDAMMQFASVRLFIARAELAHPGFALTAQNAAAVTEICHRLDGIPLALELAAARVRAMAVDRIAGRLHDRFRLLTGTDRTALPRQKTLRALIDWSYDLLGADEQRLFRGLALFPGGFTLEAVEAIRMDDGTGEHAVHDLLGQLVDKSLVQFDGERGRYRMLETVRQYAQGKLDDAGEAAAIRERHLAYFLALSEQARVELRGPRQGEWLALLDLERENLIASHEWCHLCEDGAARGLALLGNTKFYWMQRGLVRLAYRLLGEALARPHAAARTTARWRGLFDLAQFAILIGAPREAQQRLEECLAIARELGDEERIGPTLQPLAMAHSALGNLAAARAFIDEALVRARARSNAREVVAATSVSASLYRRQGNLDAAQAQYEEALRDARDLGDRSSIAITLLNLAMVAVMRSDADAVPPRLAEARAITREIGSMTLGQGVLDGAAAAATLCGDARRTAVLFGAAERIGEQAGSERDHADASFLVPYIEQARHALGPEAFAACEAEGRALALEAALDLACSPVTTAPPNRGGAAREGATPARRVTDRR